MLATTDLIAYGGLLLGLVNTSVLVYKEFFKKEKIPPKVDAFIIDVESAFLHRIEEGLYDFQINFTLVSQGQLNTIKSLKLVYERDVEVFGSMGSGTNYLNIRRGYINSDNNMLRRFNPSEFKDKVEILNGDSLNYRNFLNLTMQSGEGVTLSLLDRVEAFRWSDGWDDLPLGKWYLVVSESNGEEYKSEFSFSEVSDFYRGSNIS